MALTPTTEKRKGWFEMSITELNGWAYDFAGSEKNPNPVTIKGEDLSIEVVRNAITRAFNHVFSNEVTSKFSAYKKLHGVYPPDHAEKLDESTKKYLKAILDGTWGSEVARAPRITVVGRDGFFAKFLKEDVLKQLERAKILPGETKGTFVYTSEDGTKVDVPYKQWADAFLANEDLVPNDPAGRTYGQARQADLDMRADAAWAAAEATRVAKENAGSRGEPAIKLSL